ncbi:LysM peptidoglycan-binding domain-containing protein [Streptomyces sp. NBC_00452]|uniref:LysM peptidoglycan-binding domain-containing protein n=1 Tax=Streptomyces sp. NBC_00452 TaxID=2975746 RepID=UPI0033904F51
MRRKPPQQEAQRPRIRRRIAQTALSSLIAGSMVLSSGYVALAQTPEPTPTDEHTTAPATPTPSHTTTSPTPSHTTTSPTPSVPQPPPTPEQPSGGKTHTVAPGDTLWDISKKVLGTSTRWPSIYDANKSVIEKAAQQHRMESSEDGHWIFPGTGLTFPHLPSTPPPHPSGTITFPNLPDLPLPPETSVRVCRVTGCQVMTLREAEDIDNFELLFCVAAGALEGGPVGAVAGGILCSLPGQDFPFLIIQTIEPIRGAGTA